MGGRLWVALAHFEGEVWKAARRRVKPPPLSIRDRRQGYATEPLILMEKRR